MDSTTKIKKLALPSPDESKAIDIRKIAFQITGKYQAVPAGYKPQAGKDYIPPLNLKLLNTVPLAHPSKISMYSAAYLPESFSWAVDEQVRKEKGDQYVKIIMPPQNQYSCGGCWAFATTSALSDRFAIMGSIKNPMLGPSYLMACSLSDKCDQQNMQGCNGGIISSALQAMGHNASGIPNNCWSYSWCQNDKFCSSGGGENQAKNNALIPNFLDNYKKCLTESSKPLEYKVIPDSVKSLGTFEQIKTELYNKGPLPTGYIVFADFFLGTSSVSGGDNWKETGGIYVHLNTDDETGKTPLGDPCPYQYAPVSVMNQVSGAHAVVIVGWGVAEVPNFLKVSKPDQKTLRIPYWHVRNSWGQHWNEGGYFRIAMTDPVNHINTTVMLDSPKSGAGGPISFDPDLNSIPATAVPLTPHQGKKGQKKSGVSMWIITLIFIVIIICLFFLWKIRRGFYN